MRKKSVLVVVVCLALAASAAGIWFSRHHASYRYVNGYYDENNMYACSKPLKARYQKMAIPGAAKPNSYAYEYVPVDLSEAQRYCHVSGVF